MGSIIYKQYSTNINHNQHNMKSPFSQSVPILQKFLLLNIIFKLFNFNPLTYA